MPITRSQSKSHHPYRTGNASRSHGFVSVIQRPAPWQKDALASQGSGAKGTEDQRESLKDTTQTSRPVLPTESLPHGGRAVTSERKSMRSDRNVGTEPSATEPWRQGAASSDITSEPAKKKRKKITQGAEAEERIPLSELHENHVRQGNATSRSLLEVSRADVENKKPSDGSQGSMTDQTFVNANSSGPLIGMSDNSGGKENDKDGIVKPSRPIAQPPISSKANVPIPQPSKHQVALAKKAEFRAMYITADPSWVYCCQLPEASDLSSLDRICPSNCMYHIDLLQKEGSCSVGALRNWAAEQEIHDRTQSCNCARPADGSSNSDIIITQAGFNYVKKWRAQMASCLSPKGKPWEKADRLLNLMHNIYKHFMMEASVDQYRKRPLPLWACIEAMAWIITLLPREWYDLTDRSQVRRRYRTIIMFGSALLTMIDVLRFYKLFGPDSIMRNLDLVLALFVRSTQSVSGSEGPFGDDKVTQNENGWATVVIRSAEECDVKIKGVEGVEEVIKHWLDKDAVLNMKRDEARIEGYTIWIFHDGKLEVRVPSPDSLRTIKYREGEPRDGRASWKPEDDYDSEGIKFWKRWNLSKEYQSFYCRGSSSRYMHGRTADGVKIEAYDLD